MFRPRCIKLARRLDERRTRCCCVGQLVRVSDRDGHAAVLPAVRAAAHPLLLGGQLIVAGATRTLALTCRIGCLRLLRFGPTVIGRLTASSLRLRRLEFLARAPRRFAADLVLLELRAQARSRQVSAS